jgi:hypothetical protein
MAIAKKSLTVRISAADRALAMHCDKCLRIAEEQTALAKEMTKKAKDMCERALEMRKEARVVFP